MNRIYRIETEILQKNIATFGKLFSNLLTRSDQRVLGSLTSKYCRYVFGGGANRCPLNSAKISLCIHEWGIFETSKRVAFCAWCLESIVGILRRQWCKSWIRRCNMCAWS